MEPPTAPAECPVTARTFLAGWSLRGAARGTGGRAGAHDDDFREAPAHAAAIYSDQCGRGRLAGSACGATRPSGTRRPGSSASACRRRGSSAPPRRRLRSGEGRRAAKAAEEAKAADAAKAADGPKPRRRPRPRMRRRPRPPMRRTASPSARRKRPRRPSRRRSQSGRRGQGGRRRQGRRRSEARGRCQTCADERARQDREAELRRQLAEEEHVSAVEASPLRDRYVASLRNRIQKAWIKPPSARVGVDCLVEVTQVPGRRGHECACHPVQRGCGGAPVDRECRVSCLAVAGSARSGALPTKFRIQVQAR